MKLYPVPGGTWEGTEADWKKALKAKGLNPKDFETTKTREVPTGKKELMEFLTFFGVDVYRTGTTTPTPPVDVDALRAIHNPDGVRPSALAEQTTVSETSGFVTAEERAAPDYGVPGTLEAEFEAAPVRRQAGMVVAFIDRLVP